MSAITLADSHSPDHSQSRPALKRALAIVLVYAALSAVSRIVGIEAESALTDAGPPWNADGGPALYAWWIRTGFVIFFISLVVAVGALSVAAFAMAKAVQTQMRGSSWHWARRQLIVASAVLLGTAIMYAWPRPYQSARRKGLVAVTERLDPLVSAIERFERDRGTPPSSLTELVPNYLAALPAHPARGCRELQYHRFDATAPKGWPKWELRMECPHSLFDLDQLFYWPGSDYVPYMHNDRVGAWAYNWD